ncbi:20889_t:CDS:2, partial [Gigaspora margarita]
MGNFNENINRKTIPKIYILQQLQDLSLTNLLDFYDISEPTWARRESSSQIDDIWASYSVLLNLTEPQLIDTEESIKSDHKIIITEMRWMKKNEKNSLPRLIEKWKAVIGIIQSSLTNHYSISNPIAQGISSMQQDYKQYYEAAHPAKRDRTGKH